MKWIVNYSSFNYLSETVFWYGTKQNASIHVRHVLRKVECALNNPNVKTLCLNDTAECSEKEFEVVNEELRKMLKQKSPCKFLFEK